MSALPSGAIVFAMLFVPASRAGVPVTNAAMISSCHFQGGQSAHLIVPFGSRQIFVSIRNRVGTNDLSAIEYDQSGNARIETNGGVGKIQFVSQVMRNLMRGPFEISTKARLGSRLARTPKRDCGLPFRLSPK